MGTPADAGVPPRPSRSSVSSNAVEPGTRLVDRYRLEEHLGEADGTSYWRAQDELLDRPVGICLLPASDGNAERVLRAARRAAVAHRRPVPAGPGRQRGRRGRLRRQRVGQRHQPGRPARRRADAPG